MLLGSLDAAEMQGTLAIATDTLVQRTDRALALIESALTPPVAASLRAVA